MGLSGGPKSPLTRQKTASGGIHAPATATSPPPSLSSSMSSIPLPTSPNQKAAASLALRSHTVSRVNLVTLNPLVIPEAAASSTQLPFTSPKTAQQPTCLSPSSPSPTTTPASVCTSPSGSSFTPTTTTANSPKSKAVLAARASVNMPNYSPTHGKVSRASLSPSVTPTPPTYADNVCEDPLQEWLDAKVGSGEMEVNSNVHKKKGEESSSDNNSNNDSLFRQADFRFGTEIGNGRFSTIYKAMHVPSGALVAVKVYKLSSMDAFARNQAEREARIHLQMRPCTNITRMYGTYLADSQSQSLHDDKATSAPTASSSSSLCLVQEYSEAGDLFDVLRRKDGLKGVDTMFNKTHNNNELQASLRGGGNLIKTSSVKLEGGPRPLDECEAVARVVVPMLHALRFLHARGIIHRDLKPENILLCGPERVCKLCDFGFAIDGQEERPATRLGTTDYMAPELVTCDTSLKQQGAYDEMVDAWAVGVLAYEVLAGRPPFEGKTRDDTYENILRGQVALPEHFSSEAKDFCRRALEKDKSLRLSISAMLEHSWVTGNLKKAHLSKRHASLPATNSGASLLSTSSTTTTSAGHMDLNATTHAHHSTTHSSTSQQASAKPTSQRTKHTLHPHEPPVAKTTLVTSPFSAPQRSPIKA